MPFSSGAFSTPQNLSPHANSSTNSTNLLMRLPFLRTTSTKDPSSPFTHSPTDHPSKALSPIDSSAPTTTTTTTSSSSSSRSAPRTRPRKGSLRKVALSRGAAQRRDRSQLSIDVPSDSSSSSPGVFACLSAIPVDASTSSDSGPSPRSSTDSEGTSPWPAYDDFLAGGVPAGLGVAAEDSYISTDDDDVQMQMQMQMQRVRRTGGETQQRSYSSSSATATATATATAVTSRPRIAAVNRKKPVLNTAVTTLPSVVYSRSGSASAGKSSSSSSKKQSRLHTHHDRHQHQQQHKHQHQHQHQHQHKHSFSLAKPKSNPSPLSNASVPPPSATILPLPDDAWDYSETAWWGWMILITTWIVFVTGIGSCFGVWSWAWDVGTTPYAPPELEDDPTLPITGYYPALIILAGVIAWVWVVIAWVGMKYFRHAKISGD